MCAHRNVRVRTHTSVSDSSCEASCSTGVGVGVTCWVDITLRARMIYTQAHGSRRLAGVLAQGPCGTRNLAPPRFAYIIGGGRRCAAPLRLVRTTLAGGEGGRRRSCAPIMYARDGVTRVRVCARQGARLGRRLQGVGWHVLECTSCARSDIQPAHHTHAHPVKKTTLAHRGVHVHAHMHISVSRASRIWSGSRFARRSTQIAVPTPGRRFHRAFLLQLARGVCD